MKGLKIILFFCLISLNAIGQEYLMPDLTEVDTVKQQMEQELLYRQLLSGSFLSAELFQPLQFSQFDFNAGLSDRWNLNSSEMFHNFLQPQDISPLFIETAYNPFLRSGAILSGAAYRLNERLRIGGYSYGANSILTAPFPGRGLNNFDVRGSTFFMQYKVSKNVKIETRVNVSQGQGHGF